MNIMHKKPRGHSNVYANETQAYPDLPGVACIPMVGGSRVDTCRPLPPLAMCAEEWNEIGRIMGWDVGAAGLHRKVSKVRAKR